MALRNPDGRAFLLNLLSVLADPEVQEQDWVQGRPGWEEWADEFHDDINDGYMAVENALGDLDLDGAIGETLHGAAETEVLAPMFALLDAVLDGRDRQLPSREAAALTLQHPLWSDVVRAAVAARAVLDDPLPTSD